MTPMAKRNAHALTGILSHGPDVVSLHAVSRAAPRARAARQRQGASTERRRLAA